MEGLIEAAKVSAAKYNSQLQVTQSAVNRPCSSCIFSSIDLASGRFEADVGMYYVRHWSRTRSREE